MPKNAVDPIFVPKVRQGGAPPGCTIVHEDDRYLIAIYKNVSILVWASPATLPMVARLEALVEAAEKDPSTGRSTVQIIVAGTPPPEEDARTKLLALTKRSARRLACNVAVVEGDGFWAGGTRGMITGFHWIEDRRFKSYICASVEEAAAWLPGPHAERTSTVIDQQALLQVLRNLRARF